MHEYIIELLKKGNEVVLDLPANTIVQREWFKDIFKTANVEHIMLKEVIMCVRNN